MCCSGVHSTRSAGLCQAKHGALLVLNFPGTSMRTIPSEMTSDRPIIVAGGGPVGVITALAFAQEGLEVRVFEAEAGVDDSPRAATTHSATLEMLATLGIVDD